MTMEILLEPTSNKLLVEYAEYDESNTYVLERFNTTAGNPVNEILLKLNLPDHRSILTDLKEYIIMDVETISEKLDDTPFCDTSGGLTTQINFTSTDYHTKEELRSKGIKSLSKLLSLKYLSQSSIIEQNKNPSSPKHVHFVNSIVILNKENEAEEEVKEETEGETKEEEEDDPEHFDTFPTMKELRLEPRRKPSNPKKNCNFVGRDKGLRVFVGNFMYECDFMVLEDTTSVIDHYLGSVVFGKPFMEATRLVYNKDEGKSDDDNCEKTYYLDLGPEYKYDEYVRRGIRSLMEAKARKKNKGEVTKFLSKNDEEFFTVPRDGIRIKLDGVASPAM
ncbi:hypothetical protein Tco_1237526 [Tanacetum coccineum]